MEIPYSHIGKPPEVTVQPQDMRDVIPQKNASFSIGATGSEPLSYSWKREPADVDGEWQPLPTTEMERYQGADTAELTVFNVQEADEGQYRCVVMNRSGQAESQPATLTIQSIGKQTCIYWLIRQTLPCFSAGFYYVDALLSKVESICRDVNTSSKEKIENVKRFIHEVGPKSDVRSITYSHAYMHL